MQKNKKPKSSSFYSFLMIGFVIFLIILVFQGTVTGNTIIVLDDNVAADQIAEIAKLASTGDETKMLSEVDVTQGGFLIFTNLNDGNSATIKKDNDNYYVTGNVYDAVKVMQNENYKELVKQQGVVEIIDGEIIVEESAEEVVEEEPIVEEVVEEQEEPAEEVVEEETVEEQEELVEEEIYTGVHCSEIPYNSLSVTGEKFTVHFYNYGIYLCSTGEDIPSIVEEQYSGSNYPSISPNSQYVVYFKNYGITLYDVASKNKIIIEKENSGSNYPTSSNEYVAYFKNYGIYVYDIDSKKVKEIEPPNSGCGWQPSISRDILYYKCNYLDKTYDLSTLKTPEKETNQQAITVESFIDAFIQSSSPEVVIGAQAPTEATLGALHLAGAFDAEVKKDTDVVSNGDYYGSSKYVIALGSSQENQLSALALAGNQPGEVYTIYYDESTGLTILVVAGSNHKETRKGVKELLQNQN